MNSPPIRQLARGAVKIGCFVGLFDFLLWREIAMEAEELGFESLWVPEHLVLPLGMSGRPGAAAAEGDATDDHPHVPPRIPLADPLVALADIAARTSTIRLGTAVLVPGLRHPFVTARALMTLDRLSGGRLELGVGVGWLRSEWEATEVSFARRGARLDEIIEIWRRLWREDVIAHDGHSYHFGEVCFEPKPIQEDGPAIHVGGASAPARRRASRLGDGWFSMPDPDPSWLREAVAEIHETRTTRPRPFEITVQVTDARRIALYADTQVVDRIVVAYSRDPAETRRQMQLAIEVLAQ